MLSLVAICKDEEKNVEGFISSWSQLVDEIIIVDTGSSDKTIALLHKAAAKNKKVFFFTTPWREDFASARNIAATQACGNWIIWADLDDRIDTASIPPIRDFASEPANRAYRFQVASKVADGKYARFLQVRMYPNSKVYPYTFSGKIHENLYHSLNDHDCPIVDEPAVIIEHLGYADEEMKKKKAVRNYAAIMAGDPEQFNSDTYAQLGDSLFVLGKWANGLGYYEEAIRLAKDPHSVRQMLAEKLYFGFMQIGAVEKAHAALGWMKGGSVERWYWTGEYLMATGRKTAALTCFHEATKAEPELGSYTSNVDVLIGKAHERLQEAACLA